MMSEIWISSKLHNNNWMHTRVIDSKNFNSIVEFIMKLSNELFVLRINLDVTFKFSWPTVQEYLFLETYVEV